jgi:hypothetical protein
MQLHVVDNLLNPYANANGALQGPEYPSAFNRPSYGGLGGDPGYIPDNDWIDVLMNDLKWTSPSGGDTRNLFFTGHGTPQWMGNIWGTVGMCADDVGAVLGNYYDEDDTLHRQHPFRFVFLWGCNTASVDWARAFGVIDGSPTDLLDDIRRDPSYAQALIGYKGFGGGAESSLEWMQWSYALEYLSANWMNQVAIYRIMVEIQKPRTSDGTQLPVHFGPSSLDRNARLDIRGFGGLKRTGYTEQFP